MKKVSKRIALMVLAVLLTVGMVPAVALADLAIERGADSVTQAKYGVSTASVGDVVYFGSYDQTATGTSDPIAWRVLSNDGTNLFLLADKNLAGDTYHQSDSDVTWESSYIRSWLNGGFYDEAFSAKEKAAIATTTVGGDNTQDRLFLLSLAEVQNSTYGFTNDASRVALNSAYAGGWWLRSPGSVANLAATVAGDGSITTDGVAVNNTSGIRPALNLDLSKVLFTSEANGLNAKAAVALGSGFASATSPSASVKFTVQDASQTLNVIATEAQSTQSVPVTDSLTFSYANATTGANQYVSAILADSTNDKVVSYAKLADSSSTAASTSLSIPLTGIADGVYTLKIFSEQVNGNNLTDFASGTPVTATLTVAGGTATVSNFGGTIDYAPSLVFSGNASRANDSTATVRFSSSEAGTYYYQLDTFVSSASALVDARANEAALVAGENTISLTSLTPGIHTLYIAAKDNTGNVSSLLTINIPIVASALSAPLNPKVETKSETIVVSFDPPTSNGGGIDGYIVTATPTAALPGSTVLPPVVTAKGTTSPIEVYGLVNGVVYSVSVSAYNTTGEGPVATYANYVRPQEAHPFTVTEDFGTYSGTGTVSATIDHDAVLFEDLLDNAVGYDSGRSVAASNYTVTAGSTIITLSEAYVKSFEAGTHSFTALFADGHSDSIELTILAVPAPNDTPAPTPAPTPEPNALPKTGDNFQLFVLLAGLLALGGIGIAGGLFARRKSSTGSRNKE